MLAYFGGFHPRFGPILGGTRLDLGQFWGVRPGLGLMGGPAWILANFGGFGTGFGPTFGGTVGIWAYFGRSVLDLGLFGRSDLDLCLFRRVCIWFWTYFVKSGPGFRTILGCKGLF